LVKIINGRGEHHLNLSANHHRKNSRSADQDGKQQERDSVDLLEREETKGKHGPISGGQREKWPDFGSGRRIEAVEGSERQGASKKGEFGLEKLLPGKDS